MAYGKSSSFKSQQRNPPLTFSPPEEYDWVFLSVEFLMCALAENFQWREMLD